MGFNSYDGNGYYVSPSVLDSFVLAQQLPVAIGSIYTGRVSPADRVVVYLRQGNIGQAVYGDIPGQILNPQTLSDVVNDVDGEAGLSAGDLSAPVGLTVPGGAGLEMTLYQLELYLTRSAASAYYSTVYGGDIGQSVTTLFIDELGRAPSSGDMNYWYSTLYNTGSDLNLRQALAYSTESANNISSGFQGILSRSIDPVTLGSIQNALVYQWYTQASYRTFVAYSAEAAADLDALYQNLLGRPIDGASLSSLQSYFSNGGTMQAEVTSVAYSADAANSMNILWEGETGQAIDSGNLAYWQGLFMTGYTLGNLRIALSNYGPTLDAMNVAWQGETGQAIDPGNQSYWQQQFANGATLTSLRGALSNYGPTISAIDTVWLGEVGTAIDQGNLGYWQYEFGLGQANLTSMTQTLSNYGPTINAISAVWLGEVGTPIDQGNLGYWQYEFGLGQANLTSMTQILSNYGPTIEAIDQTYSSVTGSPIDSTSLSNYQAILFAGGNVTQVAEGIVGSDAYQEGLAIDFEQTTGADPTDSQLAQQLSFLDQNLENSASLTWQTVLGSIGSGINAFLSAINPIGSALAASPTPSPSQQAANLSAANSTLQQPNVRAFLSTITKAEGGAYNNVFGGGTFSDYSKYPNTNAAGAYQIVPGTYRELGQQLGLSDFSPNTQDLMATWKLMQLGVVSDLQNGDLADAINIAAHTWSAVPLGQGNLDHSNFVYSSKKSIHYGEYQPVMHYNDFVNNYHSAGGQ